MTAEADRTTEGLKQRLAEKIDAARAKLDGLKDDIIGMHEEDMQAFEQRRQEFKNRLDEQNAQARQMQADIASWKDEKVAHTQDAITTWRERREIAKLESRAERAADYAVDMVDVAAYDFEVAEQALLDAVAARYDANTAASASAR
jgi:chromosome segregation ATPase